MNNNYKNSGAMMSGRGKINKKAKVTVLSRVGSDKFKILFHNKLSSEIVDKNTLEEIDNEYEVDYSKVGNCL